jgi:hypothetical protein
MLVLKNYALGNRIAKLRSEVFAKDSCLIHKYARGKSDS